ncbi:MAG: DNA repair protein RadC [Verrucomicrobiota bacterium]
MNTEDSEKIGDRVGSGPTTPADGRRMEAERIADLPETERPREKLLKLGPKALTDAELLAIFFRSGTQGANAVEIGRSLLAIHGSLQELSRLDVKDYQIISGIGPVKATELAALFEMVVRVAQERVQNIPLDSPELIYEFLGPEMRALKKENLRLLLVDTRYRLLRTEEISVGTINETTAHPREILRPAILQGAYGFILAHNHPSGDPSPSSADIALTRRLRDASDLLQINFLDHLIIGSPSETHAPYYSFREAGIL